MIKCSCHKILSCVIVIITLAQSGFAFQANQGTKNEFELKNTPNIPAKKIKDNFQTIFKDQTDIGYKLRKLIIEEANDIEKEWIYNELTKRFNSENNPEKRGDLLIALSISKDRARKICVQSIKNDPDRNVRILSAYILGKNGTEEEVDALFQAVKDDKGEFGHGRTIAMTAIGSLGGIGGEKAIKALKEIWNSKELSYGYREQIISSLGMAGDFSSLGLFESILKGKEEDIRSSAMYALGELARQIKDNPDLKSKIIKLIKSYINDENRSVRANVVYSLGFAGSKGDIEFLKQLLNDNTTITLSYSENGVVKQKVVYDIREKAKGAIERIESRLLKNTTIEPNNR
jgi:HEAT repeat protein